MTHLWRWLSFLSRVVAVSIKANGVSKIAVNRGAWYPRVEVEWKAGLVSRGRVVVVRRGIVRVPV